MHDPINHRCDQDTENPAGQRKHDALCHQLPDEPAPARADGKTDGDFLAPFCSARQQQIGQVHTGQEEDEETDRSENGRKREHTIPDIGNKQTGWNQLDTAPRIFFREFLS